MICPSCRGQRHYWDESTWDYDLACEQCDGRGSVSPRVLVVGERCNTPSYRPKRQGLTPTQELDVLCRIGAFHCGPTRDRLIGLHSLDLEWWDEAVNLCWPDPQGKSWDATFAKRTAATLREQLLPQYQVVALLGGKVHSALGHPGVDVPQLWVEAGTLVTWLFLPHPSGLCRKWNDGETLAECRRLVAQAVQPTEPAQC